MKVTTSKGPAEMPDKRPDAVVNTTAGAVSTAAIDRQLDDVMAENVRMQRQIDDLNKALEQERLRTGSTETDEINRLTLQRTDATEQRAMNDDGSPMFREIEVTDRMGKNPKPMKVEVYDYRINLGPSAQYVEMNGQQFYHGLTYRMDVHSLRSLKEICYRTWLHEMDIKGRNANEYRRSAGITLRPQ